MQIDSVWLHWPETKKLTQALTSLRFVGGAVRDALLGREVSDVDAATALPPQEVMRQLQASGIKAIPTGIDHGTVTALIGTRHFEITTLRRDVTTDGRHATVAFTDDWKEDAARRDFTMNALYCDIGGEVFDYFGGTEDAAAGRVHFIGDAHARIKEDALRILRFFRFFAHYGKGAVDEQGLTACGVLSSLIHSLSGERISQEMLKLFVADRAADVISLMQRHGILEPVIPAIVKTETLDHLPHILRIAKHPPDALLSLALLLRSVTGGTPAQVQWIASRWKLSKAHEKQLKELCNSPWQAANDKEYKKQIRAWGKELFIDRVLIGMAEGAEEASGLATILLAKAWEIPQFPVTGNDLIALGIAPGKDLGGTLKAMEKAWEAADYKPGKKELLAKHS